MKNLYVIGIIGALIVMGAGCTATPPKANTSTNTQVTTTSRFTGTVKTIHDNPYGSIVTFTILLDNGKTEEVEIDGAPALKEIHGDIMMNAKVEIDGYYNEYWKKIIPSEIWVLDKK